MSASAIRKRRLLAPEVVQTSAMDCGPAALASLLEGYGISASYGRLREACQTEVDGTSIDTLEEVAKQLGLDAEQVMLPPDHLWLPEAAALPALVVMMLPNRNTHFVVLWRKHGSLVQVMDPASGRRWMNEQAFLNEVYVHTMPVEADAWREWAGSEQFLRPARARLRRLGIAEPHGERWLGQALADATWRSIAALDAAVRMVEALCRSGGLSREPSVGAAFGTLFEHAVSEPIDSAALVAPAYWSVTPRGDEQLNLRGAVLVRVSGRHSAGAQTQTQASAPTPAADQELSPELVAALQEPPARPIREVWRALRADAGWRLGALGAAIVTGAGVVLIEALLLRGVLDIAQRLTLPRQRLIALLSLLLFLGVAAVLELWLVPALLRLGRGLEGRLRILLLAKIPLLADRYFHSRLTSDMAERSHALHALRGVPALGSELLRTVCQLVFTAVGIIWLDPAVWPLALGAAVVAVAMPLASQALLAERDLRARTHSGALTRFYLDVLLGLAPIRTHGADKPIRVAHEELSTQWARAAASHLRAAVALEAVQALGASIFIVALVWSHLQRVGASGSILLLVYWALMLPALGREAASLARQVPSLRNITLRLLEPLGAPDDSKPVERVAPSSTPGGGVAVEFSAVTVRATGHTILSEINVSIAPGCHVAIVGASGAGKSTFCGLLLGWQRPADGVLRVDGAELDAVALPRLRADTAWLDPDVQLWNRSLLENLQYGTPHRNASSVGSALGDADLFDVVARMNDGLQTKLGESGAMISAGEGQRVRLGRALGRDPVRLAILDEPFRGLERSKRQALLARARERWRGATLLCVTHDMAETVAFERVLVLENGRLVEDGRPSDLVAQPGSRYRAMLDASRTTEARLWSGKQWRKLRLVNGSLVQQSDDGVVITPRFGDHA